MHKLVSGFILGFVFTTILYFFSYSRRTDFISGCSVGATFMAETIRIPMPYQDLVDGCKKYYDTNTDKINVILDKVRSEGL